jgi:hypothetical protein
MTSFGNFGCKGHLGIAEMIKLKNQLTKPKMQTVA